MLAASVALQPGLMGQLGLLGTSGPGGAVDQEMEQCLRDFVRIKTVCAWFVLVSDDPHSSTLRPHLICLGPMSGVKL